MEIFRNWQWVVTDEGVDRADGQSSYWIAIGRVFELDDRGSGKLYSWPPHMAEKTWVDVAAFNDAYEAAVRFQADRAGVTVDEDMLAASYAEAYRMERIRDA